MHRDEDRIQTRRIRRSEQLALPIVKRGQPFLRRHDIAAIVARPGIALIGEIVGMARKGVDRMDVRLHVAGHEFSHRKILIVGPGEVRALGISRRKGRGTDFGLVGMISTGISGIILT